MAWVMAGRMTLPGGCRYREDLRERTGKTLGKVQIGGIRNAKPSTFQLPSIHNCSYTDSMSQVHNC